jgi:hypothetical protein
MARMSHVRRPRSEYEALIARKHAEGLTYKELAQVSGIPESTLALWGGKLRRQHTEPTGAFIELRTTAAEGGVELILQNGVRVGVRRGFDPQLLSEVVTALGC